MSSFDMHFDDFLFRIKQELIEEKPYLIDLYETYSTEATFARKLIHEDLAKLKTGSSILEVGAGALFLSCQLAREGFLVTALEPIGDGFDHFSELQTVVLKVSHEDDFVPRILDSKAEKLEIENTFDYAFSINVMEHVDNVKEVVNHVLNSLKDNACYRFICPNYLFPYEPHFNIPTLFTKKLTEMVFHKAIYNNKTLIDPTGTWNSLNWISVTSVKSMGNLSKVESLSFKRDLLYIMINRIVTDEVFSSRRSAWLNAFLKIAILLKLNNLTKFIPATLQPVIDCTLTKRKYVR